MKIKSGEIHFHLIFTERHRKSGQLKNKSMLNNVFDVLYLNLYGYLHYSYFPGLGTNPFDMEMGVLCFMTGFGKREGENFQVRFDSKCAENRFSESFGFMALVIGDYTNHLKCNNETLFSTNKKSFMLDAFSTPQRLVKSSQYSDLVGHHRHT